MLFNSCMHADLIDMAEVMFDGDEEKMRLFVNQFWIEENPVDEMSCIKVWSDRDNYYDADDMTARAQIGRWLAHYLPALKFAYMDLEDVYV